MFVMPYKPGEEEEGNPVGSESKSGIKIEQGKPKHTHTHTHRETYQEWPGISEGVDYVENKG